MAVEGSCGGRTWRRRAILEGLCAVIFLCFHCKYRACLAHVPALILTVAALYLSVKTYCVDIQGVTFGIFGLGNKQYEHFCMVGKRMQKAMVALGAEPIVRRGDGDDDEDIEADFDAWREELMTALDASEGLFAKGEVSICTCLLLFLVNLSRLCHMSIYARTRYIYIVVYMFVCLHFSSFVPILDLQV
jgi:Flavodoxin